MRITSTAFWAAAAGSTRHAALGILLTGAATAGLAQTIARPASVPGAAAAGSAAASARGGMAYVVKHGDSVNGICRAYGLAPDQCKHFATHNALAGNKLPVAGSTVHIPLAGMAFKPEQARLVHTVGEVKVNGQVVTSGIRLDEASSIATGAGSSAVVEMADGSRVKIMPKSVADVVQNRSYTAPESSTSGKIIDWFAGKVRLTQGALEAIVNKVAPRAQPLEVETPTSLIGVRGTEFRVAAADAIVHADRAEVLSGTVSNINTWKNSEIHLGKGQGAVVDPNVAEIRTVELLQAPVMPAPGQVVRRPHAIWDFPPIPGARSYRVIAAADANFENVLYSEKLAGRSANLSGLPNGTLHMRVRGVDDIGLEGLDGDTRILLKQPAWMLRDASIAPLAGRPVLVWNGLAYASTEPVPGASTVKAELSRRADFSNSTSLTSTSTAMALPQLVSGTYYLRLGVENATLNSGEQQAYRFTIPASFGQNPANVLLESM